MLNKQTDMKSIVKLFLGGLVALVAVSCYKDNIDELQRQINALKGERIASINEQISSMGTSLSELKLVDSNLKELINALQDDGGRYADQLAQLAAMDKTLEGEIASLQDYVNVGLRNNRDWADATLATLGQLDSLCSVVASFSAEFDALSKSIDDARRELIQASAEAIDAAVGKLEVSMKQWISEQLVDYYTIAQTDAKLDSLAKALSPTHETMEEAIWQQKQELASAKEELTSAYKKAIKEAIDNFEGKINTKIAADIASAKKELQDQIDAISSEITAIKGRLDAAEANIEGLVGRIQSIAVVPTYNDGCVLVTGDVDTISFDIFPSSVADSLSRAWKNATPSVRAAMVSFNIKEVTTKGTALTEANVDTVFFRDGELKLGVRFKYLPKYAMASLHIASGSTDIASEYFGMLDIMRYDLTGQRGVLNGQEYVLIRAKYDGVNNSYLMWATQNLAVTESGKAKWNGTDYIVGDYFQWAASYEGYGIMEESFKKPLSLVIYDSFTNEYAGGASDSFTFKTGISSPQSRAPYRESSYTKYTADDSKNTLELSDDVANIVLGGNWRMPTGGSNGQFANLIKATYWAWDSTDKGCYVFKPGVGTTGTAGGMGKIKESDDKTKALLFFPAAGCCYSDGTLSDAGACGMLWSSGLNAYEIMEASHLFFSSIAPLGYNIYDGNRFYGYSVRPVADFMSGTVIYTYADQNLGFGNNNEYVYENW